MYVEELITVGVHSEEVTTITEQSVGIFKKVEFFLHKWNPDLRTLESKSDKREDELTYAKQMLSKGSSNNEVLGFQWNKETSRLYIQQQNNKKYLEGTNLSLQSYWPDFIYHLTGKTLYREVWNLRILWNETVTLLIKKDRINKK